MLDREPPRSGELTAERMQSGELLRESARRVQLSPDSTIGAEPEPARPEFIGRIAHDSSSIQTTTHSDPFAAHAKKAVASRDILWSLIETAGGVFSPLSTTRSNLDLARALEPAFWLLVAPDALGVLHDLTATLIAMGERSRRPDAVVPTASRGIDASTGTNARELARLGVVQVAAALPPNNPDGISAIVDQLRAAVGR
jgi:hypothetical protein